MALFASPLKRGHAPRRQEAHTWLRSGREQPRPRTTEPPVAGGPSILLFGTEEEKRKFFELKEIETGEPSPFDC